jgi:hypothetical protein
MLSSVDLKRSSLCRIVRSDVSSSVQFDVVDEAFKDFKSGIAAVVESNLHLLNEIPLYNLQRDDIKEFLEGQIREDLNEDPLFEKAIELGRYAQDMYKSMDDYFREIFEYHEERKKDLHIELFSISKIFVDSDLPLSFLKTLGDSLLAEMGYLDVFVREIRKEKLDLLKYRSNRPKFERVCENHNMWVDRFAKTRSKLELERVKLIWYVDFNNSKNVTEIFKDKPVKKGLLDKSTLSDFILGLLKQVEEMEKLVIPRLDVSSLLQHERDEASRVLIGVMQIISKQKEVQ